MAVKYEERKVHKVGDSLCITIPHIFVRKYNIKVGDTVKLLYNRFLVLFANDTVFDDYTEGHEMARKLLEEIQQKK